MLPFLKPKKVAGAVMIARRKPDGSQEVTGDSESENASLEACAEEIIRAITAKDAPMLANAMKAAFQIMELEPHTEADHNE